MSISEAFASIESYVTQLETESHTDRKTFVRTDGVDRATRLRERLEQFFPRLHKLT